MNYIDILKIIEENSEFDKDLNKVVNENYFHKLAEDLNTLFAKRIVNCQREQLKEKEKTSFGDWLEENNYTSENDYIFKGGKFYGFKTLYLKYKKEIS